MMLNSHADLEPRLGKSANSLVYLNSALTLKKKIPKTESPTQAQGVKVLRAVSVVEMTPRAAATWP